MFLCEALERRLLLIAPPFNHVYWQTYSDPYRDANGQPQIRPEYHKNPSASAILMQSGDTFILEASDGPARVYLALNIGQKTLNRDGTTTIRYDLTRSSNTLTVVNNQGLSNEGQVERSKAQGFTVQEDDQGNPLQVYTDVGSPFYVSLNYPIFDFPGFGTYNVDFLLNIAVLPELIVTPPAVKTDGDLFNLTTPIAVATDPTHVQFTYTISIADSLGFPVMFELSQSPSKEYDFSTAKRVIDPVELPKFDANGIRTTKAGEHKVTVTLSQPIAYDHSRPYLFMEAFIWGGNQASQYRDGNARVGYITVGQLQRSMGRLSADDAGRYIAPLNDAMARFGIFTTTRQAFFLGQIRQETSGLALWEEGQSTYTGKDFIEYTRFASTQEHVERAKLHGHDTLADGILYHGRGPLQLTWKDTYRAASVAIFNDERLVNYPLLVSDKQNPAVGFLAAAWYFSTWTLGQALNTTDTRTADDLADTLGNSSNLTNTLISWDITKKITSIVNGGKRGLVQRFMYFRTARNALR